MATITQREFDLAYSRRSEEDAKRILEALKADGELKLVEDPEPEKQEPLKDAEGNEMKDDDGNPVYGWQPPDIPTDLALTIDNMPDEGEPLIPEGIVVEVAPGTQNAAAPFPEELTKSNKRSSRKRETADA